MLNVNKELIKQSDIVDAKVDIEVNDLKNRKQKRFLQALMFTGGNVKRACEYADIDLSNPWKWLKKDEQFAILYKEQLERSTALLEAEAIKRAIEGELEEVYYEGEVVGTRMKKSDRLLEVLLKARKPEYKEGFTQNVGVWNDADGKMQINFNIPRPPKEDIK